MRITNNAQLLAISNLADIARQLNGEVTDEIKKFTFGTLLDHCGFINDQFESVKSAELIVDSTVSLRVIYTWMDYDTDAENGVLSEGMFIATASERGITGDYEQIA